MKNPGETSLQPSGQHILESNVALKPIKEGYCVKQGAVVSLNSRNLVDRTMGLKKSKSYLHLGEKLEKKILKTGQLQILLL